MDWLVKRVLRHDKPEVESVFDGLAGGEEQAEENEGFHWIAVLLPIVEVERMNPADLFLKVKYVIGNRLASFSVEARRVGRDDVQNAFDFLAGLVALAFEFDSK